MKRFNAKHVLALIMVIIFGFNLQYAQCADDNKSHHFKKGNKHGKSPFVGAWKLVSAKGESSEGDVFYPFGENPFGLLMYSASGKVAVQLRAEDRVDFEVPDRLKGTPEEVIAAWNTYDAYCGHYEVISFSRMKGHLRHYIESSLLPNWTSEEKIMEIDFEFRGRHELAYIGNPIEMNGAIWVFSVVWERVK
ncbi:MAG: lipocalin-like domain-containing protein [Desulfobacterales bacterium]|nr:lipocalin-like domain-containing protein [Desulfobacterales bacterium]